MSKALALHAEISFDALDAVTGGLSLQAPAGGSIRESTSNYSWWGMNYQQTTREAVDANGNVVGTEVTRPGSVWSDQTTHTNEGTQTTYSTGGSVGDDQRGASFGASFSTHHDADGRFSGVSADANAEAHANGTPIGDLSANGTAHGNVSWDDRGNLSAEGQAKGEVNAVDPNTGFGLSFRGDAEASGHLGERGVDWNANAGVTGAVTHNGEDQVALRLGEVGTSGHFGYDQNGDLSAGTTFRGGVLGERASVDVNGTLHENGDISASATGHYSVGTEAGRYQAGFEGQLGGNATLHNDGSVDLGANAGFNAHAQAGNVSVNGEGNVGGTAHFAPDGTYQGADLEGNAAANFNAPNFSAGVNANGQASFDENGNLTGAQGEAGANANVFGQEFSAQTSGQYDPNANQQYQQPDASQYQQDYQPEQQQQEYQPDQQQQEYQTSSNDSYDNSSSYDTSSNDQSYDTSSSSDDSAYA